MIEPLARWTARGIALLLVGPAAAWGSGMVRAPDGSGATTMLTGDSLVAGVLALAIVASCAWFAAGVGAKLGDRHEAILNTGFVLAWVAWSGGRLGEVLRLAPESGTFVRLAVEAGLFGGVTVVALLIADRLSRRSASDEGLSLSLEGIQSGLAGKAGVLALLASAGAGVAIAWLFARYDLPGQSLGTAFLGGIAAGIAATSIVQSMTKDDRDAPEGSTGLVVPALLGLLIAGVVGPVLGMFVPGAGRVPELLARGALPGWVLVSPVSWGAGAMIGVPMGVSFLHNRAVHGASGDRGAGVPKVSSP